MSSRVDHLRDHVPYRSSRRSIAYIVLALFLARPLLRFCYRCVKSSVRQQPCPPMRCTPAIIAVFFDPIVVGAFVNRPLSYFARAGLWKMPIIRQFLDLLGGLPIDRDAPQMDIMRRTITWLEDGRDILVFPEGTRTKTGRLASLANGPAMFARRAGVPVVPVYVHHTDVAWPRGLPLPWPGRGVLRIAFGDALHVPASVPRRQQDEWLNRRLAAWLQAHEQFSGQGAPASTSRCPRCMTSDTSCQNLTWRRSNVIGSGCLQLHQAVGSHARCAIALNIPAAKSIAYSKRMCIAGSSCHPRPGA